jgi:hypothetical protein
MYIRQLGQNRCRAPGAVGQPAHGHRRNGTYSCLAPASAPLGSYKPQLTLRPQNPTHQNRITFSRHCWRRTTHSERYMSGIRTPSTPFNTAASASDGHHRTRTSKLRGTTRIATREEYAPSKFIHIPFPSVPITNSYIPPKPTAQLENDYEVEAI